MTAWLCDRCGKQTKRVAQGPGKYFIQKTVFDEDQYGNKTQRRQRAIRLCDECAMKIEQLLDEEFSMIPTEITITIDRRN